MSRRTKSLKTEKGFGHRDHRSVKGRRVVPRYNSVKAFKRHLAELKAPDYEPS